MNTRNITLREGSPLHLGAVPDVHERVMPGGDRHVAKHANA